MTKILFFDIEISPIISYNWRLWQSDAIDIVEDWQILCFAYKWADEKRVHVVGQDDFPGWKPGINDDEKVVKALHKLMDEADIVVAHNGDGYDIKRANARMIVHKLTPPSPFRTVDTLKVSRKIAGFSSNKLASLVEQLDLGKKMDAGGIEVLKGVLKGTKKDWAHLKKYNKMDVTILEKLYYELLPWMSNHPSLAVLNDQPECCPKCGSTHLRKGGFYVTKVGKYKRYQCLSCSSWCRGRKLHKEDVKFISI